MSTSYVHHRHAPRQRKPHSRLLARPSIAIGVVVAAGAGFVLSVLWPGWPSTPVALNAPALPVTVSGVAFNVPPAAIRVSMQRQPGAHERLDLAFLWPSLQPPDGTPLPNVPTKGMPKAQSFERIFVTIAATRDSLSPAERLKTIYPRYLESAAVAGPEGLSIMAFREGTPYQGEDLIYDQAAPENFLVRCSRTGAAATPGTCLHIRRIGDVDVTVRFLRDWLQDWHLVADSIERLIAKLRPPGA
jgi:hypothetical protein